MAIEFLPSRLPIIQAPMAGSQGVDLCVAVCEAGGLGSLPSAMLAPAAFRDQIGAVRAQTMAPFNVNFFCHVPPEPDPERAARWITELAPDYAEAGLEPPPRRPVPGRAPFDEAMAEVVEETRPPVVSFHFGLPDEALLERAKRTGAKIYSSATTVAEARWLDARGIDAVIAQGAEAGGHRGMFLTDDVDAQPGLFALLPQVVDAVKVPVIAAGESPTDARSRRRSCSAPAPRRSAPPICSRRRRRYRPCIAPPSPARADNATRLANIFTGRPARGLLNRFMREHGPMNRRAPPFPLATGAIAPLRAHYERLGSGDYSPLWAGQAAALGRAEDAGRLTERFWSEATAVLKTVRLAP